MTISGQYIDELTGKPIPYVYTDVFTGSDLSGMPADTFDSDNVGRFTYTSNILDNGTAILSVQAGGYYQLVGGPSIFNGPIPLNPTQLTSVVSKIPWWAWILIIVGGYLFFKYYKRVKL